MPRAARPRSSGCSWRLERELERDGYGCVAGVDEAGRGSLFGPVVAAAVILDASSHRPDIDDSKKLKPAARREIALWLMRTSRFVVASASHDEIDSINIRRATFEAMKRAIGRLHPRPDVVLVDGEPIHGLDLPQRGIIRGDATSFSIAAASILAKVQRDSLLELYASEFPCYNLAKNKGYPTVEHLEAIRKFGLTTHHRRSFCRWAAGGQMSLQFR